MGILFKFGRARRGDSRPRHHGRRLRWQFLAGACAIASVATMAAACSSGGASGSGQITLTELDAYPAGLPQYAAYQWLFSTYEKTHPNVKIQRESVSGAELLPKELADAQTHSLPDIINPLNAEMPNLEATGQLVNLDSDLAKWGQWGNYLAGSKAIGTSKSGTYGIQIGANDLGIFYNKKIFAEAGIKTVPTTWAQLLSDSQTIMSKVSGLTYGAIGVGAACGDNWQLLPYIYQQGLDVNQLTNPGVAAALNFWDELLKDGVANKEIITQCQSTNIPQFVQGKLAMVEDGPWDLPTLAADHFSDWGVFAIPLRSASDQESVPLGGELWSIPVTNSATEAAAWNFIEWSQTPSILLQFDQKLGYFSVRPSLWPAEEKADPAMTPFITELKDGQGMTSKLGASFNTYATGLNSALVQVLEGQKTAQDALSAAQSTAQATIGNSGN